MFKKTFKFLFCVRPGISPTRAFYSGFFAGGVLTYYVYTAIKESQEALAYEEFRRMEQELEAFAQRD